MKVLELNSNYFTGELPTEIGALFRLEFLDISYNLFSGCIPSSLGTLENLSTAILMQNNFGCSIDGIFKESQEALETLLINNNIVSGTIPSTIFDLPHLRTISLASNCFSRTSLPTSICNAVHLESIVLDGLHTSPECVNYIFGKKAPIHTFYSEETIYNGIPSCIFSLPRLKTLHLSGNSIRGSFDEQMLVGSQLKVLQISNNKLSGRIPVTFQNKSWTTLDLSVNRFDGTLAPSAFPNFTDADALKLRALVETGAVHVSCKCFVMFRKV